MSQMDADLMKKILDRLDKEGEKVFYSRGGAVVYTPLEERDLYFKAHRRNQTRREIPILRLLVCGKQGTKEAKPGIQYFVPISHRKKKARYFEILSSHQTIYDLAKKYKL